MNNESNPENFQNIPSEDAPHTTPPEAYAEETLLEEAPVSPASEEADTNSAQEYVTEPFEGALEAENETAPIEEYYTEAVSEETPAEEANEENNYPQSASPVYVAPPVFTEPSTPAPIAPAPEAYYYPQPQSNKKGGNVLIVFLWVLIALFALGFFGLCGYIIGVNSGNSGSAETQAAPTLFVPDNKDEKPKATVPEATEEDIFVPTPDEDVVPMPDDTEDLYSDNTSVKLNPLPSDKDDSNKYTTQYAYKTVASSTIGVVCYEGSFSDKPASQGTGIVISEDGYIATNSHVIGDSRSLYYVEVITNDGTIYEAKVIGFDSRTDLAVLKINANGLIPTQFCDSEYVEVGQDVIAVGNPGGIEFQNSLTRGVVSALNRQLSLSSQVSYIQTDAAINPGNSGGPLCNIYGQVIGINTAKISASAYEGMGFAIPSRTVKEIVDDLISKGYVENRVRLGISGQEVSLSMQEYYDIPAGVLISEVVEDGPCDGKGIETNDVLTAIDDETVETFSDIYASLAKHKPGDEVVLSVYKMEQEKTVEITVTLMADEGETQQ